MALEIRRLGPGDEDVVRRLAEREPQTALLADERTVFLAALDGTEPVGFLFGYELPRRHGDPSIFFVYEVEVAEAYRRQRLATLLFEELERVARSRGIRSGFVLTEEENDPANRLYERAGGEATRGVVMWDFTWSGES